MERNGITKADRQAEKNGNLIKQDFTAYEPNRKWLFDITEIPCLDGKLYLSAVLDCYDGAIVCFTMEDNMKAELVVKSFKSACKRHFAQGTIFHSDRGSQYTSNLFRASLAGFGAIQSMSGTGRCYDNRDRKISATKGRFAKQNHEPEWKVFATLKKKSGITWIQQSCPKAPPNLLFFAILRLVTIKKESIRLTLWDFRRCNIVMIFTIKTGWLLRYMLYPVLCELCD